MKFSINDEDFEVLEAPCFNKGAVKAWSKWTWTNGKNEGGLYDNPLDAQKAALLYAEGEAWQNSPEYKQQLKDEKRHNDYLRSPYLTGRI